MPPILSSKAVIAPRSQGLSPGAIAGAVVGSVLGGSILLIILGFLYFRHKRISRQAQADEALPLPKASGSQHVASFPWPDLPPQPTATLHDGRPPFIKDERPNGTALVHPIIPSSQRSLTSIDGENWIRSNEIYASPATGHDPLPQDISFSLPRQQTFPATSEHTAALPLDHASTAPEAANRSYYDTRISMDSDPAQAITPPSRQMSDMYKAQRKEAEEHRKRSGSIHKRIWNSLTRRSTHASSQTAGDGAQSPSLSLHMGASFVASPGTIKPEPGLESSGMSGWQGQPNMPPYFEEPGQIAGDASISGLRNTGSRIEGERQQQQPGHRQQERQTQDSQYGVYPPHRDSTIRQTTEGEDPTLPSSVLRTNSTYGLPLEAQPQSPAQHPERLKSPEIPEPMDVDGLQPETNGHSPFRSSHSPQLSSESFINPMDILHPTNPVEQAAYNTYQIKHSASPPAMPPSPPEIVTQQPTQEDTVNSPPPMGDEFADMYLDLPSDDENRRSSDSYEYPTTPGQSSTADSSGRTPDTQPTVSPSPFPTIPEHDKLKPEPQPGLLICPECGRSFDQIHKLNHHKRYHDRTHECTYEGCDKKFGTKTHLDRHINDRHLKLRAYHCTEPSCPWFKGGKSFPRKDNWRRHMVKKHGSTPQDFAVMETMFG
ncbi:hypothetical protein F5Y19DRAFT_472153 [Xylariaceae sp. FL1651]|nr:hypothetical protein F5Y19DRAFT_472153 [Xylariaceae sp. FL1651]